MTPHYSTFDEFKEHSASIARGLNNTKISVLREAMVQAMGFKNVSAYKASFESGRQALSPADQLFDPHIYFYVEDDLLWFQGRIDFDDEDMTDAETGEMNGEWLTLDEPININPDVWLSMSKSQQVQWQASVSSLWFGDGSVTVHQPLSMDGGRYTRASFPVESDLEKSLGNVLVSNFLISQHRMSRPLFLGHIFMRTLHDILLSDHPHARTKTDLVDAARRMRAESPERFDLRYVTRQDREPVLAIEDVRMAVKKSLGWTSTSHQSDFNAVWLLKSCVSNQVFHRAHDCVDLNKQADEWSWSQMERRMVEKVFDWGLQAAEIALARALFDLPQADLSTSNREVEEACKGGLVMYYSALYFAMGVPAEAEMGRWPTYKA